LATEEHTDTRTLLAAIGVLLERGFGKPPQAIEHSGRIDNRKLDPALLSDDELAIALAISRKLTGQPVPELTEIRPLLEEPARRLAEGNRNSSAQST
jgi:hypothetical protein